MYIIHIYIYIYIRIYIQQAIYICRYYICITYMLHINTYNTYVYINMYICIIHNYIYIIKLTLMS